MPSARQLRLGLLEVAYAGLPATGLAVGLLFLLIAVSQGMIPRFTDGGHAPAWALFTAAVSITVALLAWRRVIPCRAAHQAFAAISMAVLAAIVAYETQFPSAINTFQLGLYILVIGLLVYSPRWWALLVAAAVVSWFIFLRSLAPVPALHTDEAILAGATAVSAIILGARITTLNRLETARLAQLRSTREFDLALDALQQSETQFRDLFNHNPDAVFIEDYNGNVLDVNPAACRLHGMTREQLRKCNVIDLVPPRLRDTIPRDYPKLVRGTWEQVESYSYTADGREVPVEVRVTHISYQGKPALLLHARDITQRIRSANALRDSEARQRKILASLPMALYTAAPNYPKCGTMEWVTRNSLADGDTPLHMLINDEKFWLSRIHPDDRRRVLNAFDTLAENGSVSVEYRWKCSDGTYRWFLDQPTIVRDECGEPYQVIGTWVDVTERKNAEKDLRESESRFRLLVEHAADAFFLHTPDGRILDVNQKACLSLGYSREQLLDMSMTDIDANYSVKRLTDSIDLMELGVPLTFETKQQRLNGSHIPVEMRSALIEFDGRPVILGLARDITERKRTEAELQKHLQLMEGICRNMPVVVFRLDGDGRLLASIGAGLRRMGYADHEGVGQRLATLCPQHEPWINRVLAGEDVHYETSGETDGETWSLEFYLTPDRVQGSGALGFGLDVTERKLAEAERAQLTEDLRQAQKLEAIGTLAAGVAHDFNNVTTAIGAYLNLAMRSLEPGHPARRHLAMIEQGAKQAGYVTQSLLTFAHRNPSEKTTIDLVHLVDEAARLLHRLMPATVDLQACLPVQQPIFVHGDEGQLQRVLMNLAVNARDAMPEGGKIRIHLERVTGDEGAAEAKLTVSDTGMGMDAQTVERIFEPFYTTQPRGKGTGLGLAVVHGIVTDHGARITVDSAPGEGTRVTIWLKAEAPAPQPAPSPHDTPMTPRGRILLVVESEYVGQIMATTLEAAGYEPVVTAGAAEVPSLTDADPLQWRAVIIDVDLPDGAGAREAARLRRMHPDLPVLPIGRAETVNTDFGLPALTPLIKPFEMAELVRRVNGMVMHALSEEKVH